MARFGASASDGQSDWTLWARWWVDPAICVFLESDIACSRNRRRQLEGRVEVEKVPALLRYCCSKNRTVLP
jgi:hypothetical protein